MHDTSLEDPADRPNLVCLSGLLCDDEVWHGVVSILGEAANAQVFSFADMSSITAMASHVLARSPQRFAIAGHSMGGRVGLEILRLAPERVTGIALLNTGVHPTGPNESRSRGELVEIAREQGMGALAARWLPPMLGRQRPADDPLVVQLTRMIERSTPASFIAQVNALLNRPPASEVLDLIRVPALLLSATADTWSPPAQHAAMQKLCPGPELVVIEDAGHMSLVEQPRAVAAALSNWLERVRASDLLAPLTRLDELEIADACTQLIHRFARFNDLGEWEALSALFIDDGVLHRPSDPQKPIRGRAEILTSFQGRPSRLTRHVVANVEVTVESNNRAGAISSIVLYTGEMVNGMAAISSTSVGHFEDTFQRVGRRWLFAERRGQMAVRGTTR